jgi:hypothetical protein
MARLASVLLLASLCSCAAASRSIVVSPMEAVAPAAAPSPAPLDRSLFAPRGGSGLSEEELARILDAPLGLKLPARVGVASLGRAFEPCPPQTPDAGLAAVRALAESLEGSPLVTVASEMSSEIPTGGGVEGLRELAARYRASYLVLYSERFEDRTHANGFAALWPTILGGLLTPSQTLRGDGVLSVSLLDVRTGTILFTLHEAVRFESMHLPVGAGAAWADLRRKSSDEAAKALAARVLEKFQRVAREADAPAQM